MKKVSKRLSLVLILAMMISMFSGVMSASAASSWSFNSCEVDGTYNFTGKNQYYDFNLFKNGKEVKANDAVYKVAWSSSDSNIVWINASSGQARSDKFGKMTGSTGKVVITARITNKSTGKSTSKSFTATIGAASTSSKATKLEVFFEDGTKADEALKIGTKYDLGTRTLDASGKALTFAQTKLYRAYFCEGLSIASDGSFTPTTAGTYVITASTFKSKAEAGTAKEPSSTGLIAKLTVVVQPEKTEAAISSVRIADKNTVIITLKDKITKEEADKLKMVRLFAGRELDMSSSKKSISLDSTGKIITYVTYSEFINKNEYIFRLGETECKLVVSIGEAVGVRFSEPTSGTVIVNTPTKIEVEYYDANGIEVAPPTGSLQITASTSTYAYFDNSTNQLSIYKAGETVILTCKYVTNEYNADWSNKVLPGDTITVLGVEKPPVSYTSDAEYTIADSPDWTKKSVDLYSNDTNKRLFYRVKLSDGTYTSNFTYQSANSNVVLVNSQTGLLVPVGTGSTQIIITAPDSAYADLVTITVRPASKPTGIIVTPDGPLQSTNAYGLGGKVTFKLMYVDQYSNITPVPAGTSYAVEARSYPTAIIPAYDNSQAGKITFLTEGKTAGSYGFKVIVGDFSQYVNVTVTQPDAAGAIGFRVMADKTSIDTAILSTSTMNDYLCNLKVVGIDKTGAETAIAQQGQSMLISGVNQTISSVALTLTKASTSAGVPTGAYNFSSSTGTATLQAVYYSSTSTGSRIDQNPVAKLEPGVYNAVATVTIGSVVRTTAPTVITITNSGTAPTVTLSKEAFSVSRSQVATVAMLTAYIQNTANGVLTLPANTTDCVYSLDGIVPATAITDGTGFESGPMLIRSVTVTKTYGASGKSESYDIQLNRTVSITITN